MIISVIVIHLKNTPAALPLLRPCGGGQSGSRT